MEGASSLVKTLCLKHCSYYKPGKNEELACRGFHVVERLMQSGRTILMETRISADKQVHGPAHTISAVFVPSMSMTAIFSRTVYRSPAAVCAVVAASVGENNDC
jgi:hypothetical protein